MIHGKLPIFTPQLKQICKSIQEGILQNNNDTITNSLKPNDLKDLPIIADQNCPKQASSF